MNVFFPDTLDTNYIIYYTGYWNRKWWFGICIYGLAPLVSSQDDKFVMTMASTILSENLSHGLSIKRSNDVSGVKAVFIKSSSSMLILT